MDKSTGQAVIIGNGAVGAVLADKLRSCGRSVVVYDKHPKSPEVLFGDACCPAAPLESDLRLARWVILALPDSVLPTAIAAVAPCLQEGALLVETSSVKRPLAPCISAVPPHLETLGINPLFSPSLGFAGRSVATVHGSCSVNAASFEALLTDWGARVVGLSADQHDEIVATVQAASHAALIGFGAALSRSPARLDQLLLLATPPFRCLLLLFSRLVSHAPEVLWSIQTHNVHAAQAREAAAEGILLLDRLARRPEAFCEFDAWVAALRGGLASMEASLKTECNDLFSALTQIDASRENRSQRNGLHEP
jgi:4-amino-4-deoxyprephenate dehydrogenase